MKKSFRRLISDYFSFTRGERNAFFVLTAVAVIISLYPLVGVKNRHPEQTDFTLIKNLAAQAESDSASDLKSTETENFQEYPEKKSRYIKFNFDPNTATLGQLQSLGFRKYLAERMVKFRNSGGKFYVKSDIRKIYGISPEFADELMPYIDLPETREFPAKNFEQKHYTEKKYTPLLIDINTADTAALNRLKGIGHKLSQRIVSFREKLGGFYSLDQLNEVYGLKPEVIEELKPKLKTDFSPVHQMNINSATLEDLGNHPYIKKNLAGIIINYRTQHGPFLSVNDLLKIKVLDEITFNRIKNYLKV